MTENLQKLVDSYRAVKLLYLQMKEIMSDDRLSPATYKLLSGLETEIFIVMCKFLKELENRYPHAFGGESEKTQLLEKLKSGVFILKQIQW